MDEDFTADTFSVSEESEDDKAEDDEDINLESRMGETSESPSVKETDSGSRELRPKEDDALRLDGESEELDKLSEKDEKPDIPDGHENADNKIEENDSGSFASDEEMKDGDENPSPADHMDDETTDVKENSEVEGEKEADNSDINLDDSSKGTLESQKFEPFLDPVKGAESAKQGTESCTVDDSRSMSESNCGDFAVEALVTVCRAMAQLEAGQLAVVSFGEKGNIKLLHDFELPFSRETGVQEHYHFPEFPPPFSPSPFLFHPQENREESEELKRALLRATVELESTRAAAQDQLRRLECQAIHLSSLLQAATRERDEARSLLLLLLNNPHPQPTGDDASTSRPSHDDAADDDDEEEGSNNVGASPPPPPPPVAAVTTTAAAEAELEAAAERRGLPERGKLLEAVVRAGPLLQTLLLAGPLPQWRHPPPALQSFEIPPVSISLSSPESHGNNRKYHKSSSSSFPL
ncbi:hypothetical protein J5N97_024149 [Dioscorea zingiberensis]|uniref:Uncharacterized protein n=1 Tax=Dioscorea zingiberensis TaxID=325984 RepID=A0A9D5H8N8_9LILI|nr:hypothetical protein J5N97_024149 [Dioscorea zingiberensis]